MSDSVVLAEHLALMLGGARVLDDVSFRIEAGQTLAIVGRSGAGKTLLLRLLAGLERPSEGRLTILGANARDLDEPKWNDLRRRIGVVLDGCPLLHDLNLAENLAFPLLGLGLSPDKIEARLEHCLINFDLDPWRTARVDELSGSIAKRARLARAFITEPDLLLFDAPFDGLDSLAYAELQDDLHRLLARRRIALVVTTHDQARAEQLGADLLVLEQGRLSPPR